MIGEIISLSEGRTEAMCMRLFSDYAWGATCWINHFFEKLGSYGGSKVIKIVNIVRTNGIWGVSCERKRGKIKGEAFL